jgi:hypothetical protein
LEESYKEKIAGKGKVELVHVNRDRDEDGMKELLMLGKCTFPAVKHSKVESLKVAMLHKTNYVPCYVLVDAEGNLIVEGKDACLAKAEELIGK